MTPEEADKKIEFILQMQAQFESNIGKLRDSQAALTASVVDIAGVLRESVRITDERFTRLDERLMRLTESQQTTDQRIARLANGQHATEERMLRFEDQMARLADSQRAGDDRLSHLDSIVRELAEAGKATDDRLNALISVVERHITGPDHSPQAQ